MRNLVIKNFGPLNDINIQLKKYNFFIGGQGVGKSSIAKVFCMVTNYKFFVYPSQKLSDLWMSEAAGYDIAPFHQTNTLIRYEEEDTYESRGEEHRYRLKLEVKGSKCHADMWLDGTKAMSKDVRSDVIVNITNSIAARNDMAHAQSAGAKERGMKLINAINNMLRDTLYIPADRIMHASLPKLLPALNLAGESMPKNVLYFSLEYIKAKETRKEFRMPMLGVDYLRKDEDDYIIVRDGKVLPMGSASSGMQSTIPLVITFDYAIRSERYHGYVIEEPECNLFPTNQLALMDYLIAIMHLPEAANVSFTVTTHSPYIVNYLNVMIRRQGKHTEKPAILGDNLTAYYITDDGRFVDLVSHDGQTEEMVINTFELSETMRDIYEEYKSLK